MKRIVVIAPHPDDEVLGCGATIAKYVDMDYEVFVIVATKGIPEMYPEERIAKVRKDTREAHEFLGVKETFFLNFPAPKLNVFPECEISIAFSEILNTIKPSILFIPHPSDLHQDHKAVYRAAIVSARPINEHKTNMICCYETLSETNWFPVAVNNSFVPNLYIDVSNYFEKKLHAMEIFKFQIRQFPHCRSLEGMSALATYRGVTVGVAKAEAFVIERQIIF
jgi:LmbE family N-acetylglucosaminyl deacetylase